MEALTEICETIEENPTNFSENLVWICQQCPNESDSVSRNHLNAVLAVARIISTKVDTPENHGKLAVLDFLHAVPNSFRRSFWPCSFTVESISDFYCTFLGYVASTSLEFGSKVVEIAMVSCDDVDTDPAISRAFLVALSRTGFPSIQQSDGVKLITMLLHRSFEDESMESLEKQEISFKLMALVLDKVKVDSKLYDEVSSIAWRQLQSISAFLKSRKRDWDDQDPLLKARVNAKLFVYQAAAKMKIKSLLALERYKKLVMETLTLVFDAAEACLTSVWRKMKACEELFISLLSGIVEMTAEKGRCSPHGLFVRLKPLVLAVCAQPDTWVRNPRNIFESVSKICCEIIESGWVKDRALVNTFIVGLASRIHEKNGYEEQVGREKEVPTVPLNVIKLLADISVAVKKPEVTDMVFPFFIETLEEGDTSTHCSLRFQLLDAVSRIATLGFEKSL